MAAKASKDIVAILAKGTPVDLALARGVREALRRHCQAAQPAAEWRDGKTVWLKPAEIKRRIAGTAGKRSR